MTNTGVAFDLAFHALVEVAADHPGVSVDEGVALAMWGGSAEPVSEVRTAAVIDLLLLAGPRGVEVAAVEDRPALRRLVAAGCTRTVEGTRIRLRRAFVAQLRAAAAAR